MPPDERRNDDAAGYPRSTGSARSVARRRELLTAVADDVAERGMVDFSLRRAAVAAGTSHKVLLYHFADSADLLAAVATELRARRIGKGLASAMEHAGPSLAERVRAFWPVLIGAEQDPLLQAVGLAIYDPDRYEGLVRGAAAEYLQALRTICPSNWSARRKTEVAELILAAMRGLLLARRIEPDRHDVAAGLAALERALAREEADDKK